MIESKELDLKEITQCYFNEVNSEVQSKSNRFKLKNDDGDAYPDNDNDSFVDSNNS